MTEDIYIFAGGSSEIAKATLKCLKDEARIQNRSCKVIALTTKDDLEGYDDVIRIVNYDRGNLPIINDPLKGIAYFPGSINLKPINRISKNDLLSELNINAVGAFTFTQQYLDNLKTKEASSILYISSVAGQIGLPFHTAISMAKGAIQGLTLSLAAELAPKVRVNCIAPSLTNTPLASKLINSEEKLEASKKRNPLLKVGEPKEIAELASFLLTDKSSWITGQVISVDGGMGVIRNN